MNEYEEYVLNDHMNLVYDPATSQVTQLQYSTPSDGIWTRVQGEWMRLSMDDESTLFMYTREIAPKNYLETRDYFDSSVADKKLTYEEEYRMWFK